MTRQATFDGIQETISFGFKWENIFDFKLVEFAEVSLLSDTTKYKLEQHIALVIKEMEQIHQGELGALEEKISELENKIRETAD